MSEDIYTGWGIHNRMINAAKGAVRSVSLNAAASRLNPAQQGIVQEIRQLGLDRDDGLFMLAGFAAEDIIKSFDNAPRDVTVLPFYTHLRSNIANVFAYERLFNLPAGIDGQRVGATSELWAMEQALGHTGRIVEEIDKVVLDITQMFRWFVTPILEGHPQLLNPSVDHVGELSFDVPLAMVLADLAEHVERMVQMPFAPEFDELGHTRSLRAPLEYNVVLASGGVAGDPDSVRSAKLPTKSMTSSNPPSPNQIISSYLGGTPLEDLFDYSVPIVINAESRFQHHHIVAGSGHGKTQTLQHLILHDLETVAQGGASIVVLDSQGDLIKNIASLKEFAPGGRLADRLVLIDPTDVEYPVALNLFDVGMERINQYSQLDRERLLNGVLELYDFVLGSLLAAEMTQKQTVIFRYITRLLLHIPGATIHTLRELLEDGGAAKYQSSIDQLQGSARAFFATEFDSREFVATKRQVVRRLWGILENQTFERMFTHPKNKLDLYSEMNAGKVILINTAKDLLKKNGTEIFGRFFIALIAQAAQERATINKDQRMPTFVYVDEAQDYFDQTIELILEQARKYKVGMILAHQHLGQLDSGLRDAIFGNTAIKFAGGLSSKDARSLALEIRTQPQFIEAQPALSFAAFVRGSTKGAVSLSIEPGAMEQRPHMSEQETLRVREKMRSLYAEHYTAYQGYGAPAINDNPDGEAPIAVSSVNPLIDNGGDGAAVEMDTQSKQQDKATEPMPASDDPAKW